MPTTDLIRLVESPTSQQYTGYTSTPYTSLGYGSQGTTPSASLFRGTTPSFASSSLAMSLGQCPVNHVYHNRKGQCVSVHSHSFADKALRYALSKSRK